MCVMKPLNQPSSKCGGVREHILDGQNIKSQRYKLAIVRKSKNYKIKSHNDLVLFLFSAICACLKYGAMMCMLIDYNNIRLILA